MNPGDDAGRNERPEVDLSADALVESLRGRGEGAGGVPFAGLLDNDDDPEYLRVYQDYELRTYVRIPLESVRHRERVRNSNGVEVSIVFVDPRAEVEIREVNSEQVRADELARALTSAGAAQAGTAAGTPTPTITVAICTRIFCTNITCACTSRHSTLCSILCSDHPFCPRTWFCRPG